MKATIQRTIEAEQWNGDDQSMPKGAHFCRPKIRWSAGREFLYFTYAEFRSRHWISIAESSTPIDASVLDGGLRVTLKDGREYWRRVLPFAFYDLKSESSVTRDWHAVYLQDDADEALMRAFVDYADLEEWLVDRQLPLRAEYRLTDGAYGRGFRPLYMKPGDWLLHEPSDDGKPAPRVVSDEQFALMRAA